MSTPQPEVTERLTQAMAEQGVSIKDLALATGITYEHSRRLVRGAALPHGLLLREICTILALPYEALEKLANKDSIKKKYGNLPIEMAGKDPELQIIERSWKHLTADQKNDLNIMAQQWAKRNKALGLSDAATS